MKSQSGIISGSIMQHNLVGLIYASEYHAVNRLLLVSWKIGTLYSFCDQCPLSVSTACTEEHSEISACKIV